MLKELHCTYSGYLMHFWSQTEYSLIINFEAQYQRIILKVLTTKPEYLQDATDKKHSK